MTASAESNNENTTTTGSSILEVQQSHHDELPGPWAKTYQATTKEELIAAYAEWSTTYDVDSIQRFGYLGPQRAAEELVKHLSNYDADRDEIPTIADVGAGTGLVGEELYSMLQGKCRIVALDYSPDMLDIARKKGCYSECLCVDLLDQQQQVQKEQSELLLGNDSYYDAVISVGTFTPNHLGKEALDRVVRMVKPHGGVLCLSLREDFVQDSSNGFLDKLLELEADGTLTRIHRTEPELYTRKVSDDIFFRCWIYKRM